MVIHQFNKLIRNKWLWGAFAIAISAFFAFDFLIADLGSDTRAESTGDAGTLAGKPVDGKLFSALVEEVRGFGQQRDWQSKQGDVNRQAWENYAALMVAEKDGLQATDAEVAAVIRQIRPFLSRNFKQLFAHIAAPDCAEPQIKSCLFVACGE